MTAILVFAVVKMMKFSSKNETDNVVCTEEEVNVAMQRCGAYEVIQLSKQRVIMNENPAYGETGTFT